MNGNEAKTLAMRQLTCIYIYIYELVEPCRTSNCLFLISIPSVGLQHKLSPNVKLCWLSTAVTVSSVHLLFASQYWTVIENVPIHYSKCELIGAKISQRFSASSLPTPAPTLHHGFIQASYGFTHASHVFYHAYLTSHGLYLQSHGIAIAESPPTIAESRRGVVFFPKGNVLNLFLEGICCFCSVRLT